MSYDCPSTPREKAEFDAHEFGGDPMPGPPPKGDARRPHLGRLIVEQLRKVATAAEESHEQPSGYDPDLAEGAAWIRRLCDWHDRRST